MRSGAAGRKADEAVREIVHLHEGVVHREWLQKGQLVRRQDLNGQGKAIRRLFSERGKLARREYADGEGNLVSRELFDEDGFITESIYYRDGEEYDHFWFERGEDWVKEGR